MSLIDPFKNLKAYLGLWGEHKLYVYVWLKISLIENNFFIAAHNWAKWLQISMDAVSSTRLVVQ